MLCPTCHKPLVSKLIRVGKPENVQCYWCKAVYRIDIIELKAASRDPAAIKEAITPGSCTYDQNGDAKELKDGDTP